MSNASAKLATIVEATHFGFSDESNYNAGRFRSVGLVTMPAQLADSLRTRLTDILRESDIRELKWKALRSGRDRHASLKVMAELVEHARLGQLRVDVLTWDGSLPSDLVTRRKDTDALSVYQYHVLRTVLARRWPKAAKWAIRVDRQDAVDWKLTHELTNLNGFDVQVDRLDGKPRLRSDVKFDIVDLSQCDSKAEPFIQVADLFAGMAAWSRDQGPTYAKWRREPSRPELAELTSSQRERFAFLRAFESLVSESGLKMHLGLNGLRTFDPACPINFWHWRSTAQAKSQPAPSARGSRS